MPGAISTSLVGDSPPMQAVKTLDPQGRTDAEHVLITGESGTGKELVARALHALGPDADDLFLAINCAAIPHDLLENQLFGHVRGAFTGADRDHAGLFVAAGRGTVFLDEIGELARSTQAKLLRAIENKEVLPVGATRPVSFQAGLLAATNKDLAAEVAADRFRADLYYRLNVVVDPPASLARSPGGYSRAGRRAPCQARHRRLGKRVDGVDNATIRGLMAAAWIGNVRELDNALERAVILSEGPILTPDDFPPGLIVEADGDCRRRQPPRGRSRLRAAPHPAGSCASAATTSAKPPAGSGLGCRRFIESWRKSAFGKCDREPAMHSSLG